MAKRKTADDYRAIGGDEFEWLETEVPENFHVETIWRCKRKHVFRRSYFDMSQHHICPLCKPFRKTEIDYQRLAAKKNLDWLGPYPKNMKSLTRWRCKTCGHERQASYMLVAKYSGCPKCGRAAYAKTLRHTAEDYDRLGDQAGLIYLGPLSPSIKKKTHWQCKAHGHQLLLSYYAIHRLINGTGGRRKTCRQCYLDEFLERKRKKPEEYHALANNKGMVWLGPYPGSINRSTLWKAGCGHYWSTSYQTVSHCIGLCPECMPYKRAAWKRLTADEYHKYAQQHRFEWIGRDLPANSETVTRWRCPICKGEFERTLRSIYILKRCPLCRKDQIKTEADYHRLADENNMLWSGNSLPDNTNKKTKWFHMKCHQEFERSYQQLQYRNACPKCKQIVNGTVVTKPQMALKKAIEELWGVECRLNESVLGINIDIVTEIDHKKIAAFYDGYNWHGGLEVSKRDQEQTKRLLEAGWYVWRVQSDTQVPEPGIILGAFSLIHDNDEHYIVTRLPDWGKRPPLIDRIREKGEA